MHALLIDGQSSVAIDRDFSGGPDDLHAGFIRSFGTKETSHDYAGSRIGLNVDRLLGITRLGVREGLDPHDRLAQNEMDQVKLVGCQVPQHAAPCLIGIAPALGLPTLRGERNGHQFDPAQAVGGDQGGRMLVVRSLPVIEPHYPHLPRMTPGVDDALSFFDVDSDRFFEVDVLASRECVPGQ
jgi:hypothetical protein